MSADSTRKRRPRKTASSPPEKPYGTFPLTPHASGKWQKKIGGVVYYFGRWGRRENGKLVRVDGDGWREALAEYKSKADDLHAGRKPQATVAEGELTVAGICNQYLNAMLRRRQSGRLSPRSFHELKGTCDTLVACFGKRRRVDDLKPSDFAELRVQIDGRCGIVRQCNEITRVRGVFKFGLDNQLIAKPVVFGSEFKKPSKAELRRHKATSDKKMFSAAELRQILDALENDPTMKAAVLLGINAGAGNTDVANLEAKHIDLDSGWLNYPRGKTGVARRVPLWSETVSALRAAIAERPEPRDEADADCALLTPEGKRWVRVFEKSRSDCLGRKFGNVLRKLHIGGRRGFYCLRHTLASVGLQAADRDAVRSVMGHVENDMLAEYDETGVSDQRLQAVTDHVHAWILESKGGER